MLVMLVWFMSRRARNVLQHALHGSATAKRSGVSFATLNAGGFHNAVKWHRLPRTPLTSWSYPRPNLAQLQSHLHRTMDRSQV